MNFDFFFKKSKVKKKIPKAQFHCNISLLFLAYIKIVFFQIWRVFETCHLIVLLRHICHSITQRRMDKKWLRGIFCNTTSVCDVVMDFLTPKMRIKYLHLSAKVCRAGTDYKTHLPTELHYITGGWCGGISCQESQCNLGMGRFTTSFLEKMRPSIQSLLVTMPISYPN